ncbi:MAG: LegC family aminotransferase [Pseudomonadota bacterium]
MSTATQYNNIIAAIKKVIGDEPRPVALHEPLFIGNEEKYVASCVTSGWVSSVGEFVDRFERELAEACAAKYAVAVVNGTCALHIALVACGVQPNDEVLVPSLTFVATANSVSHASAIPHFVEVEENSLGICPVKLDAYLQQIAVTKNGFTINKNTGRIIRAIVPVHVFGHPCQLDKLHKIAKKYNLLLIEDATEALGSKIGDKPIGSHGIAVLSFNGNKIITTGGGGAILVQDEALYKKLKHLTTTAKKPHPFSFEHDEIAWNYRLPNLNAALGCAQLEQLPRFLAAKRALAKRYIEELAGITGINILPEPKNTQSNYWLVTMLYSNTNETWRDEILSALHQEKILCRPTWTPLHQLPMYKNNPRADLQLTENLHKQIISLPSSVKLGLQYV